MPFIEAPTTFYLGRRYDPATQRLVNDVVYYDSRDLTTHAVVVGMTGSGKTGLCINLLEEATLDNIPSIVIDPKGDITNLLLSFPDLRPEDFAPWINPDDAIRAGMDANEYAADVATRWREGLQAWGIVPDRLRWLKRAAQYSIYTPGSDSGLPISILDAMQAPAEGWVGFEEAHRERISGIVTALLGLIGRSVDPVKDREHVLIANIFENAWKQGQGLTLEDVIIQVQQPPFAKLGVFDVNTFFPEKDRFKLAMELNHIIAAPSFQSWITGEPLDVRSLLYQPDGRPKVSILYIAHLNDAERQFIITLLLENVLSWMRSLSGTTSLRALLYVDEVFGLFPPHPYNPPTKEPMMRLLKQARAFGLGLILATQNPGDLDYKGLSNAGTWFIGKLQSENDRKRVMAGLEGLVDARSNLDVGEVGKLISRLDPRVFVMHNIHDEGGPMLFHTRWAMSYLRGPLTRQQVATLMAPQRGQMQARAVPPPGYGGYSAASGYTAAQVRAPAPAPAAPAYTPAPMSTPAPSFIEPSMPPGATPPPATLPELPPAPASLPEMPAPAARPAPPMTLPPEVGYPPEPTATPAYGSAPLRTGTPAVVTQSSRDADLPPGFSYTPPVLPSSSVQYFLPNSIPVRTAIANWERQYGFAAQKFGGAVMVYKPILLAQAGVRFLDRRTGINAVRQVAFHVPDVPRAGLILWDQFVATPVDPSAVAQEPFGEAIYGELSPGLTDPARMKALQSEVIDQVYHGAAITVLYSPTLKVYSQPDATRRDFRAQLQQVVREQRDAEIDKVGAKYDQILDKLDDKIRKLVREMDANRAELADRRREQLFTAGEAALSLFRGRTTYTLSRYSRAQRYSRQSRADLVDSEQEIADLEDDIERRKVEMEGALKEINDRWARIATEAEEIKVSPYKKDIYLELFGIGWLPFWYSVINGQPLLLPASAEAARG